MDNKRTTSEQRFDYRGHGGTFKNTLSEMETPDPSVVYQDGYYYMTFTHNGTDVMVLKSRTIDFRNAERRTVWYPPAGEAYSSNLWAPEIQYIQGKWYIYFAADDGLNENHRMYALQADSNDPMGDYTFKGQITDSTNKWAIDGLAMEHEGKLYFIWSGWEGDANVQQNTYIAPMSDPLAISGPRVLLNEPTEEWERAGGPPYINEGQSILKKDGRVHLVYSGAGSWTPYYSLGLLSLAQDADPLDAAAWRKAGQPLMQMDDSAGVYGPGHNSFVRSPDGTEDWIVYHGTSGMNDGWANRKARAQLVTWQEDGTPAFGKPLSLDTAIEAPAGTGVMKADSAVLAEGKLTFGAIPSSQDAEAPLLIHYRNDSGEERMIGLSANGGQERAISLPATKPDATGYAYATVALKQGMNEIALAAGGSGVRIEAIEIPRYEAENAQAEGTAEAEDNPFASGWGIASLADGESAVRFPNVVVPLAGTYVVRVALSNPSEQAGELLLSVDGGKPKRVEAPKSARNEFVPLELEVELGAGKHEFKLTTVKGKLNVDYMDIRG